MNASDDNKYNCPGDVRFGESIPLAPAAQLDREWVQKTWFECNQHLYAFAQAIASRRTEPAAAQLDAELPPLPEPCKFVLPSGWIRYTAQQYRQGQREAQVAALAKYCGADAGGTQIITRLMTEVNDLRGQNVEYAERIRLLEREKEERKQSIDMPEFQKLAWDWAGKMHSKDAIIFANHEPLAWEKLIAYIDGRTAGTAPEGWKLVPTKPTEEMHVAAVRAIIKATGNDDFPPAVWSAMIAAAPSPGKEDAK